MLAWLEHEARVGLVEGSWSRARPARTPRSSPAHPPEQAAPLRQRGTPAGRHLRRRPGHQRRPPLPPRRSGGRHLRRPPPHPHPRLRRAEDPGSHLGGSYEAGQAPSATAAGQEAGSPADAATELASIDRSAVNREAGPADAMRTWRSISSSSVPIVCTASQSSTRYQKVTSRDSWGSRRIGKGSPGPPPAPLGRWRRSGRGPDERQARSGTGTAHQLDGHRRGVGDRRGDAHGTGPAHSTLASTCGTTVPLATAHVEHPTVPRNASQRRGGATGGQVGAPARREGLVDGGIEGCGRRQIARSSYDMGQSAVVQQPGPSRDPPPGACRAADGCRARGGGRPRLRRGDHEPSRRGRRCG